MFHVKHDQNETIAAIATPRGSGGIGVIRISGDQAKGLMEKLVEPAGRTQITSRKMLSGWVADPQTGEKIDRVYACYFKSPKTFTGEDVVEIFCHGGTRNVDKILETALKAGARLAGKGEFSKRAFLNGKIDLTQAEAILDLVKAETEFGMGFAVKQLEGKLSKALDKIRNRVINILSGIEAGLDFEEDVEEIQSKEIMKKINDEVAEIDRMLAKGTGRIYREGLSAVIAGKPNVGKSSLLNKLLGEERAIVTDEPGTTRDAIEEKMIIKGMPIKLIDTAGIRLPKNEAESKGIERAGNEINEAGMIIAVLDGSSRVEDEDKKIINMINGKRAVVVLNKVDLGCYRGKDDYKSISSGNPVYRVSAKVGTGIDTLIGYLSSLVESAAAEGINHPVLINERHRECLGRAREGLLRAISSCSDGLSPEFIAIDLKEAVIALGEVTGEVVTEEVINKIFDQFCVGK